MDKSLTLILGGARSGKSSTAQHTAQQWAAESGAEVLFVATATAGDDEMRVRIAAHQAARPAWWRTLEAPLQVGRAIAATVPSGLVVVDCLTLLASNILFSLPEPVVALVRVLVRQAVQAQAVVLAQAQAEELPAEPPAVEPEAAREWALLAEEPTESLSSTI
jgi:adenosylcobinamide kinase/adenosylcobinamide-phosphate guanylyltransferase